MADDLKALSRSSDTLATGLARASIRDVAEQVATAKVRVRMLCDQYLHNRPKKKAAIKRLVQEFDNVLKPLSIASAGIEVKRKTMSYGWLLPMEHNNQLLLGSLMLVVNKAGFPDIRRSEQITITAHALGRLLQRSDLASIQFDELKGALAFATAMLWPIITVGRKLRHKQFALPCDEGLLVGKFDANDEAVVTTYIHPPMATRWQQLLAFYNGTMGAVAAFEQAEGIPPTTSFSQMAVGFNTPMATHTNKGLTLTFTDCEWAQFLAEEYTDGE